MSSHIALSTWPWVGLRPMPRTLALTEAYNLHACTLTAPLEQRRGEALPSAVVVSCAEHRLATGRSGAGARICCGTGVSPLTLLGAGEELATAGELEGVGVAEAVGVDEHPPATSASTTNSRPLPAAAQLPLDRCRDLISGKVIEPVIVRSHALREVGTSIDRVGLVHRRNSRQVLHRRQVAVVTGRVVDERVDVLGVDKGRDLLGLYR